MIIGELEIFYFSLTQLVHLKVDFGYGKRGEENIGLKSSHVHHALGHVDMYLRRNSVDREGLAPSTAESLDFCGSGRFGSFNFCGSGRFGSFNRRNVGLLWIGKVWLLQPQNRCTSVDREGLAPSTAELVHFRNCGESGYVGLWWSWAL